MSSHNPFLSPPEMRSATGLGASGLSRLWRFRVMEYSPARRVTCQNMSRSKNSAETLDFLSAEHVNQWG